MKMMALIFGEFFYRLNSFFIAYVMRVKGIKVGKNFYIQGVPKLKILGKPQNIIIKDNVKVFGDIDIRNRENGKIVIDDGVSIDEGCRFVSANNATLHIHKDVKVGLHTIFNCGDDVTVGQKVLISGFCYIQSSNHGIKKNFYIQDQSHTYGKIDIKPDVWLASHVTVLPGVTINKGAVIGAKAVVTTDISEFSVNGGVPAKEIGNRE